MTDRTGRGARGRRWVTGWGRHVARVLIALTVVVTVSMLSSILQGTTGGDEGARGTGLVRLASHPPTASGNCPDAQTIAARAAALTGVIGPSVTRLRLLPTTGCAARGKGLRVYRTRVRLASLTLWLASADWSAAGTALQQGLARAHVRALHDLYPRARILVLVSVAGRTVWQAGT